MPRPQSKAAANKPAADRAAERTPAPDAGSEMLGSGNLDQVREILFGAQSRGLDKRLARIEEELPKRLIEIREELKRGLATLETYARTEIDSLNDRLRTETRERDRGDALSASKLDEASKSLRKEIGELGDRTTAAERDIRQQMLAQAKRLDDEIQRRTDDLAAALARAVEELRLEKADRKVVASILHEVALRLTDELPLQLGEGAKS